jgi:hypothetical protein
MAIPPLYASTLNYYCMAQNLNFRALGIAKLKAVAEG